MKIVSINGQVHKGSSYHMGKILADKIGGELTEFFLPKDLDGFCKGCYACLSDEKKCYMYENKKIIMDAMEAADVIIFTSPNYCMAPSGAMKSFLDFLFDMWMVHRPKEWAFSKKAVILSASAGASCKAVCKTIKASASGWGIPLVLTYGKAVHASSWSGVGEKTKAEIEKDMAHLAKKLKGDKKPKIKFSTKADFNFFGFLHKKGWDSAPAEKTYWQERGWLGKTRPWKKK